MSEEQGVVMCILQISLPPTVEYTKEGLSFWNFCQRDQAGSPLNMLSRNQDAFMRGLPMIEPKERLDMYTEEEFNDLFAHYCKVGGAARFAIKFRLVRKHIYSGLCLKCGSMCTCLRRFM